VTILLVVILLRQPSLLTSGISHINTRFVACRPHVLCATLRGGKVLLTSFAASRAWGYVF
jgi:hypothetical protein